MDIDKIIDKLGIEELNSMQESVMDSFLHSDKDLVVLSPTGSGKTLAYLLPMVQRLAFDRGYYELALYLEDHRKEYAHFILTGEAE